VHGIRCHRAAQQIEKVTTTRAARAITAPEGGFIDGDATGVAVFTTPHRDAAPSEILSNAEVAKSPHGVTGQVESEPGLVELRPALDDVHRDIVLLQGGPSRTRKCRHRRPAPGPGLEPRCPMHITLSHACAGGERPPTIESADLRDQAPEGLHIATTLRVKVRWVTPLGDETASTS
jgi:hypothetical protein